jgi:hypothetical protein
MKSKNPSVLLCHTLGSFIVVLVIGFLGLGVRAFATANTSRHIFSAAFAISLAILVLYFMLRRPTRELTAYSLFHEPPFVQRFLLPRLSTIGGNPLTLDHLSERRSRADLVAIKTSGGSLTVSP